MAAHPAGRLMGTSIAAAIDYLVTNLRSGRTVQHPLYGQLVVPALNTIDPNVEVADNFLTSTDSPWVAVGRTTLDDDNGVDADAQYLVLGAQEIEESYTIPVLVMVEQDGTDQKTCRDAAVALYDGIVRLVWADPSLGGLLRRGRIAMVSNLAMTQPPPNPDSGTASGAAVSTTVSLSIQIKNTYLMTGA